MKKFALFLAVLLLVGSLAGCKEEKTPNMHIEDYSVHLVIPNGWKEVDEHGYDLWLKKGDGYMAFRIYNMLLDFDPAVTGEERPNAEELFEQCNAGVRITEPTKPKRENWRTVEKAETVKSGEKEIITALFAAEENGKTMQYLCCMVDFHNDAEIMGWVVFVGSEDFMKKNRSTFETILEDMTCDAERVTLEELAEKEAAAMADLEAQGN